MGKVPCRTSRAPLACRALSYASFNRLEAKRFLAFQGRRGIASVVRWNLRPVIFGVEKRPQLQVKKTHPWTNGRQDSRGRACESVQIFFSQKKLNSRGLELSISKNTTHGRWGQGPGSVDPRFPAGLPFSVPQILEFVVFCDSGKIIQQFFPGLSPDFSSGTPRTDSGNSHSLLEFSDAPCFRREEKQGEPPKSEVLSLCRTAKLLVKAPCPPFPCFVGKRQGKPAQKQGFFIPTEPLKYLEKKGENAQTSMESLARRKNKEINERKGRTW